MKAWCILPFSSRFLEYTQTSNCAVLVQEHRAIECVALDRLEAGVADDSAQFFFRGAVAGAGGAHPVLFQHDRTHIVAAEVEAQLQNLQALRYPACLHILDVIEIEASDGKHLQVFDAGGFFPSAAAEGCVLGLEAPGDEG